MGCQDRRHRLADVTPERVNSGASLCKKGGRKPYKAAAGADHMQFAHAAGQEPFRAGALQAHVGVHKPAATPFKGVKFYPRESMRYPERGDRIAGNRRDRNCRSKLKIFLLATMAGFGATKSTNCRGRHFAFGSALSASRKRNISRRKPPTAGATCPLTGSLRPSSGAGRSGDRRLCD